MPWGCLWGAESPNQPHDSMTSPDKNQFLPDFWHTTPFEQILPEEVTSDELQAGTSQQWCTRGKAESL